MRMKLRIAAIAAGLLFYLPLHYLWRLFGVRSRWPRAFLGWVGRSAGMRLRVIGTPLNSHVLIVSNHVSWLDIMMIADASGAAFVSKDDVAGWPVIGWLARLNNTVFVARTERKAVRGQADELRAALIRDQPVALFPEGTTSDGRTLLPFRASLFASVSPAPPGVMVQPVAIDYGAAAAEIAWIGDEPAGANAKRILSRPGTNEVTLRFLEPIDPASFPHRKALAEAARSRIAQALGAFGAAGDPL